MSEPSTWPHLASPSPLPQRVCLPSRQPSHVTRSMVGVFSESLIACFVNLASSDGLHFGSYRQFSPPELAAALLDGAADDRTAVADHEGYLGLARPPGKDWPFLLPFTGVNSTSFANLVSHPRMLPLPRMGVVSVRPCTRRGSWTRGLGRKPGYTIRDIHDHPRAYRGRWPACAAADAGPFV